jgi:uncharacterized membrane protein
MIATIVGLGIFVMAEALSVWLFHRQVNRIIARMDARQAAREKELEGHQSKLRWR